MASCVQQPCIPRTRSHQSLFLVRSHSLVFVVQNKARRTIIPYEGSHNVTLNNENAGSIFYIHYSLVRGRLHLGIRRHTTVYITYSVSRTTYICRMKKRPKKWEMQEHNCCTTNCTTVLASWLMDGWMDYIINIRSSSIHVLYVLCVWVVCGVCAANGRSDHDAWFLIGTFIGIYLSSVLFACLHTWLHVINMYTIWTWNGS